MTIDKSLQNKQGVYVIHIAHHIYVGSSVNLYQRLKVHFLEFAKGTHDNVYMQRAFNKYGLDSTWYEIAEICSNVTIKKLRERELYYIQWYKADLNLKKDPTTEQNCITVSKVIYQYTLEGELVRSWPSTSEAARYYNVHPSNIACCCLRPQRQQLCQGFLWARQYPYPHKLPSKIYVFDLHGNLLGSYFDTGSIVDEVIKEGQRKTLLSQLRGKIDSNVPYKHWYLSSNPNFQVTPEMKAKYHEKSDLEHYLDQNPLIYIYDRANHLLGTAHLQDLPHSHTIKQRILQGVCYKYSITKYDPKKFEGPTKKHKCKAQNCGTGEIMVFNTRKAAAIALFGNARFAAHIGKHLARHTPFRNYNFWDL